MISHLPNTFLCYKYPKKSGINSFCIEQLPYYLPYQLQSEDFYRLRIGIATDENMRPSEKFVLSPFQTKDEKLINNIAEKAFDGINYYLSHDIKQTMNKYNEKKQGTD